MNPYQINPLENLLKKASISQYEQNIKNLIETKGLNKARDDFFDLMVAFFENLKKLELIQKQRVFDYLFYLAETSYDIGVLSMYGLQSEVEPQTIFYWIRHHQEILQGQSDQSDQIKAEYDFLSLVFVYVQRQLNQDVDHIAVIVERVLDQIAFLDGVFLVLLGRLIFDLGFVQQTTIIANLLILNEDDWLRSWGHCQYLNYYLIKGDFVKAQQHSTQVSEEERAKDFELNHIWNYLTMLNKLQRGERYDQELKLQVLDNLRSLGDQTLIFTTLITQIRDAIIHEQYESAQDIFKWAKLQRFHRSNIPLRLWVEFKLCEIDLEISSQSQKSNMSELHQNLLYQQCIKLLKKINSYQLQEVKERIYHSLYTLSTDIKSKRKWAIKTLKNSDNALINGISLYQLSSLSENAKKQKKYFYQSLDVFRKHQLYLDLGNTIYDFIHLQLSRDIDDYGYMQLLIRKALFYYSKDLQFNLLKEEYFKSIFINAFVDRIAFEKHFYPNLTMIKSRIIDLTQLYLFISIELQSKAEIFFSFYLRQQKFIFESNINHTEIQQLNHIRHLIKYQIKQEIKNRKIIKSHRKLDILSRLQKQLKSSDLLLSFQMPEFLDSIENITHFDRDLYEIMIFKITKDHIDFMRREISKDQLILIQNISDWMSDTSLSGQDKYEQLIYVFAELQPLIFEGIFDFIPMEINRLYLELTALKSIPIELFFNPSTGVTLFDRFEIYHLHGIDLDSISLKIPKNLALIRGFDRYIKLPWADQEYQQLQQCAQDHKISLLHLDQETEEEVDLIHYIGHAFIEKHPSFFSQKSVFIELYRNGSIERIELSTLLYSHKIKAKILCFSACHTTKTEQGLNIDDLLSALLIQDTQALICAQWPLPDQSTLSLMNDFYLHFFQGLTLGLALKKSALTLRATQPSPLSWCNFRIYLKALIQDE
jgi:hypothetical protein